MSVIMVYFWDLSAQKYLLNNADTVEGNWIPKSTEGLGRPSKTWVIIISIDKLVDDVYTWKNEEAGGSPRSKQKEETLEERWCLVDPSGRQQVSS